MSDNKKLIKTPEELKILGDYIKKNNSKLVFTNGCFDILHIGHIRYLREAKKLGDYLFIALNSDISVKKLKGNSRPINSENIRAEILSELISIDYIYIFQETTASETIEILRPNIYAKGGDYDLSKVPEKNILDKINSEIIFLNFQDGFSTSSLIQKIKNN